jgi:hypothetical protein
MKLVVGDSIIAELVQDIIPELILVLMGRILQVQEQVEGM